MGILLYSTSIDSSKTAEQINALLRRRGVRSTTTVYDDAGNPEGVEFSMETEYGRRHFALPIRTAGVLDAMSRDRTVDKRYKTREQAERTAWQIAYAWLKAQSALIDAGLVTQDEIMLPFMRVTADGATAYEVLTTTWKKELEQ